jgi:hypothetical protein
LHGRGNLDAAVVFALLMASATGKMSFMSHQGKLLQLPGFGIEKHNDAVFVTPFSTLATGLSCRTPKLST